MTGPRILHIITDLNGFGGTEATLLRYLSNSTLPRERHKIVVLKQIGTGNTIGAQIVQAGFPVVALGQKTGKLTTGALMQLYREAKNFAPDVISAWLYHPALLAALLKPFLPSRPKLVWHIRSLTYSSIRQNPGRYLVQRLLSAVRGMAKPKLVTNSRLVIKDHGAIGFPKDESAWTVIPNGLDTDVYFACDRDRTAVRRELSVPDGAFLVGCVGRFVPEKGYPVFFDALTKLCSKMSQEEISRLHVMAVGNGVCAENPAFRAISEGVLPSANFHFLEKRSDIPRLLRGLDFFVLSSVSEAFPNSLLEAMATALPVVATDVGACAEALPAGEPLVAPGDTTGLCAAMHAAFLQDEAQRARRGDANRQQVVGNFTLARMVSRFDTLFQQAAARH